MNGAWDNDRSALRKLRALWWADRCAAAIEGRYLLRFLFGEGTMKEFLARFGIGTALGAVVLGGSHVIGHPVAWWAAWLIGLALVFLGEWVGDALT